MVGRGVVGMEMSGWLVLERGFGWGLFGGRLDEGVVWKLWLLLLLGGLLGMKGRV